jgi:hypothetical protein
MRITFFVYDTLYATIFLETPFWRRFGKTYHVSFTRNMIHPLRNELLLLIIDLKILYAYHFFRIVYALRDYFPETVKVANFTREVPKRHTS